MAVSPLLTSNKFKTQDVKPVGPLIQAGSPQPGVKITPGGAAPLTSGGFSAEEMQANRNRKFNESRMAPTVPTPKSPVTTIGGSTPQQQGSSSMEDVFVKRNMGQSLSEDDFRTLYQGLQAQFQPVTLDSAGYQPVLDRSNQLVAEAEKRAEEQKRIIQEQEKSALDLGLNEIAERSFREQRTVAESAKAQGEAAQRALSFSGFGRSTVNADRQEKIQANMGQAMQLIQSARSLEEDVLQARLRGVSSDSIGLIQQNIDNLRNQAAEIETKSIQEVVKLNQQQGVKFEEALSNIKQAIPESQSAKVSEFASQATGFLSDEFGKPVLDPTGNKIAVSGTDAESAKYQVYEDPYTGQSYFYNPFDPADIVLPPGAGVQSYEEQPTQQGAAQDPFGFIFQKSDAPAERVSSPTTNTKNKVDITDKVNPELQKFADNCYLFAKQIIPNIPSGASTVQQRRNGIQTAQKGGYGGSDMSQVKPGDAIHTNEGAVGHTAIVESVDGTTIRLLEANLDPKRITRGRELQITDPRIIGWIRPTNKSTIVDPPNLGDGAAPSIQEQISGLNFKPDAVTQFKKFMESGTPPSFSGTSQSQKDYKEAAFRNAYNLWAATNPAQAIPKNYDLNQVNSLATRYKPINEEIRMLQQGNAAVRNYNIHHTNPWDDQTLLFSFLKVLDPGSVVREREYSTAENYQGLLNSVVGKYWRNAINGEGTLTPAARTKILETMDRLYNNKVEEYDVLLKNAKNVGMDFRIPSNLYLDYEEGALTRDRSGSNSFIINEATNEVDGYDESTVDQLLKNLLD